jgi:hypothetical protein
MNNDSSIQELANRVDMLSKTLTNEQRADLTSDQTEQARQALVKDNLLFPRSVKAIHDPVILGQEYGLVSFTPAKDVKPNANGIYGVFKLRGNFATLDESQSYAEKLIRNHDSYNEIHTVRVGQCIPLSKKTELVDETNTIDLNKEVEAIVSNDVKEKRQKERVEMKTIQEREQQLLKENKEILDGEYQQDPLDQYIMLRVKKAQLMWTLAETRKRIENEVIPAIKRTKEDIQKMNQEYPEFDKQYYQRYIDARESVGIKDQDKLNYSYFMQYLLDENDLNLD